MNLFVTCLIRKGFLVMQITSNPENSRRWRTLRVGLNAVVDFIYPPNCLICRTFVPGEAAICDKCLSDIGLVKGPRCWRCGCPGANEPDCANCSGKAYAFQRLITLSDFTEEIRRLVHALKYQGRTRVAAVFGKSLGELVLETCQPFETAVIVPVPLHPSRERERGYNQSGLLASAVATRTGLPVLARALRRLVATDSQTKFDLMDREHNVKGAFQVKQPGIIQNRTVLLVDDVVTTGATANSCTRELLRAGASEVVVTALASPYIHNLETVGLASASSNAMNSTRNTS